MARPLNSRDKKKRKSRKQVQANNQALVESINPTPEIKFELPATEGQNIWTPSNGENPSEAPQPLPSESSKISESESVPASPEALSQNIDVNVFAKSFGELVVQNIRALTESIAVATGKPYFRVEPAETSLYRLAGEMYVRQEAQHLEIRWSTIAWFALLSYAAPRAIAFAMDWYEKNEREKEHASHKSTPTADVFPEVDLEGGFNG